MNPFNQLFNTYDNVTPPSDYVYRDDLDVYDYEYPEYEDNFEPSIETDLKEQRKVTLPQDNTQNNHITTNPLIQNYGKKPVPKSKGIDYSKHSSKFEDQIEFSHILTQAYKKALKKHGLSPEYATIFVAQDAYESGYGNKVKGDFNYGNIAAGDLGSGFYTTKGSKLKLSHFKSIDGYVEHKIKLLKGDRYNFFNNVSPNADIATAMQYLADKGYCPNTPQYGKDVANVHKSVLNNLKAPLKDKKLVSIDIEDLLKQEGITEVNGKKVRYGSRELRGNVSYGAKNSYHKKRDPDTGYAAARDISIEGGTIKDYMSLRRMLLNNNRIKTYFKQKRLGIIPELTPETLKRTGGTGLHLHIGQDEIAVNTWNNWDINPDIDITKVFYS